MKSVFNSERKCITGTVSASTPLSTQIRFVFVIISEDGTSHLVFTPLLGFLGCRDASSLLMLSYNDLSRPISSTCSTKFWISVLLGSELLHLVDAGIFSRDLIFSERAFSIRCFCSSEVVLRRSMKIEGSSSMILRRGYLVIQWQT